jgi:hypothetical protein
MDDKTALDRIAQLLAGTENWDADTLDGIAELVQKSGRPHPGQGVFPYLLPGETPWPPLAEGWRYYPPEEPDDPNVVMAFHGDRGQLVYSVSFAVDTDDHEILVTDLQVSDIGESHWVWYDLTNDQLERDDPDGAWWRPRGALLIQTLATSRAIWRDKTITL